MTKKERAIRNTIKLCGIWGNYEVRVGLDVIHVASAALGHKIVRALREIARREDW